MNAPDPAAQSRVVFIDLVRAFAVLMMIQGHTIDVFLGSQYRDYYNIIFNVWNYNRGMTAPLFLFGSGMIVSYLYHRRAVPWRENPRVLKGVKRFFSLLAIGYLMHFPTPRVFDLKNIPQENWNFFFGVDVLQLIAFGVLFIVLLNIFSEQLRLNYTMVFAVCAVAAIALFPIANAIQWNAFLHQSIAGYFYRGTGSNFPFFPWLCYMFFGAIMGGFLAKNPEIYASRNFAKWLLICGAGLMACSQIGDLLERALTGKSYFWETSPNLILLRMGYVLIVNGICSIAAKYTRKGETVIKLLGRYTLFIYVAHMIVLYGSPWTLGTATLLTERFSPVVSVLLAIEMIGLMIVFMYINEWGKKQLQRVLRGTE